MRRRVSVLVLSVILMFTSINWNGVDTSAAMISSSLVVNESESNSDFDVFNNSDIVKSDDTNGITNDIDADLADVEMNASDNAESQNNVFEEIVEDSIITADAVKEEVIAASVWKKLNDIAKEYSDSNYETAKDEDLVDDVYYAVVKDEDEADKISFVAENEEERLTLLLSKDIDECEIIYTVKSSEIEIKAVEAISTVGAVLEFIVDETIDSKLFANYKKDAEELLKFAIVEWDNILDLKEISWTDLGFENWNKLCDEYATEIETYFQENDELSVDIDAEIINGDIEVLDADYLEASEEMVELAEIELAEDDVNGLIDSEDGEKLLVEEDTASEERMESYVPPVPSVERIDTGFEELVMRRGEELELSAKVYPENARQNISFNVEPTNLDDVSAAKVSYYNTPEYEGYKVKANGVNKYKLYLVVKDVPYGIEKRIPITILPNEVDAEHDTDENGNKTLDANNYVIAEGIWVGGFEKSKSYTGKPVTQDIAVYCKGEKLTIKKDYNLSYKNNINACSGDVLNAPSVTISMAGKYSGKRTLYYEIRKADISGALIETNETALIYNGKIQKYVPTISFEGKKLANNKDFTIDYVVGDINDLKGDADASVKINYCVNGKGNFFSSLNGSFYITPKQANISKASVSLKSTVKYDGSPITVDNLELKIKLPGTSAFVDPLEDSSSYKVRIDPENPTSGTAKVTITGIGGVACGYITKTFKVVPAYNLATVAEVNYLFKDEVKFYRNPEFNKQINEYSLLNIKGTATQLVKDKDYEVTYSNINKLGTAKITFKGIGAYSGSITKSYKLIKNDFNLILYDSKGNKDPETLPNISYVQGNNKQSFKIYNIIKDPHNVDYMDLLTENVDYTVKYVNNVNAGDSANKAKIIITPKGAYAGAEIIEKEFVVDKLELSTCLVTVADKAYSAKANVYKSVPSLVAPNGKKLVAGKDYEKIYNYEYKDCDENIVPLPGDKVTVVITGKGNYKGTATGAYTIYDSKTNGLNKLYFSVADQIYTGRQIEPKLGTDIKVYLNAADYKSKINAVPDPEKYVRIVSYKNNIKNGTGTVILGSSFDHENKGYGGTKNVSFKISKKNYDNNAVVSVSLNQTNMDLQSISSKQTAILTAQFKSTNVENSSLVDNATVVWKSSDSNIVSIEPSGTSCTLTAQANGKAVISCTTQDGNKVAKCIVKSIMKPITSISGGKQNMEMNPGEKATMNVVYYPDDAYVEGGGITYSSSNTDIVTVDSKTGEVTAVSPGIATVTGKFNNSFLACFIQVKNTGEISYIDVTSYGAIPDDMNDDTFAFYYAITALKSKPVGQRNLKVPSGKYIVSTLGKNSDSSIYFELNDAYIYMEPGAVIVHDKDESESMRGVITLDRCNNIVIEGGLIDCQRASDEKEENYFGIMIVRSSDILINNVMVKDSKGDGIYIGKQSETLKYNHNISIKNCTISGCRRNNIALCNADNVTIQNCNIKGATGYIGINGYKVGGTGIDIEPNSGENVKNVKIYNCIFADNRSDFGIHCHYHNSSCQQTKDITLDGCSFDKLIAIQCGKNVVFKNTVDEPDVLLDDRLRKD